jgi:SNF2 family DNA or RNA helicase
MILELPEAHINQTKILESTARFRVVMCGRRFGKSELSQVEIISNALQGMKVAYITPTYKLAKTFFEKLTQCVPFENNKSDLTIHFPNGGTVEFFTGERLDNLRGRKFHLVVIDEAQNIKNINTEQTKAIKSIGAANFIAMSGTPVENKLSELWSIMDYSNRGFLGSNKEFNETYGNPIQQFNDIEVANQLKKVTAPFLMRRLKSDKTIISDLPDKIEIDSFATLVKEQASLYEKTLHKALEEIEGIEKSDNKSLFVRQGLVLQMIMALKQICNHPTQFLKNNILDESLSGKMELLFDKLDSIVESGEKVLLFTQFSEMGNLLKHFISKRYNEEPMFYHGGCTIKQRNEMVNAFQNNRAEKIFILSLKAAGTGLNLTAANHVIHYDLWWNPAVESQATDRAYRIGQKNNVMVHRFITKNTFEEKINEMIQGKKALANMTVATGENWIGNLSNKELRSLFEVGG